MNNFKLDKSQQAAFENITKLSHKINVLNGGPGCVDGDTEFLTPKGWKKIKYYINGEEILQWHQNGKTKFVTPVKYIKSVSNGLCHITTKTVDMALSLDHRVPYITSKQHDSVKTLQEVLRLGKISIPRFFYSPEVKGISLTDDLIRVLIMQTADGYFSKGRIFINVKKKRKQNRVAKLLNKARIRFTISKSSPGYKRFCYTPPTSIAFKNIQCLWGCNYSQLLVAFDELPRWDGSIQRRKNVTTLNFCGNKGDCDLAQYVFSAVSGKYAGIHKDKRKYVNNDIYSVSLSSRRSSSLYFRKRADRPMADISIEKPTDGMQYCFETPSGFWLARRNNKIFPTGNSGKTTTIKTILKEIWDNGNSDNFILPDDTQLCSPTGKAAKVLDSALQKDEEFYNTIKHKPATIHRMLGCHGVQWEYDRDNRLECKLIIVDETSMVDSELLARLIYSVSEDCIFILVGDMGQLPPVSAGQPFHDIISLNKPGMINTLNINHRAAEGGMIAYGTDLIRDGRIPKFGIPGGHTLHGVRSDDLFHKKVDDKEEIPAEVLRIIKGWHEQKEDYQVLAPQHSGACGINALNTYLQEELNPGSPGKPELKIYDYVVRPDDKVINKKNNYKLDIFNGYTGVVLDVGSSGSAMVVDFDGQVVTIDKPEDIKNIKLCYCMSIHASQGSEYQRGVLVIHSSHSYMLSRPLLYVGVSRFKEELWVVGDDKGLRRAVKNNKVSKRQTYLSGLKTKQENKHNDA